MTERAFGEGCETRYKSAIAVELAQIDRRRTYYCYPAHSGIDGVGLALSGGGIRSATFSLGVLRGLAHVGKLNRIDYLSTVSGGSYIGAFLGSLYVPIAARGSAPAADAQQATDRAKALESDIFAAPTIGRKAIERLRQFGRYLAPGGNGDIAVAIGIIVRNWLAIQMVVGISLLTCALVLNSARLLPALLRRTFHLPELAGWSPWWVAAVLLSFWPVAAGWAYWLTKRDYVTARLRKFGLWWALTIVIGTGAAVYALQWPQNIAAKMQGNDPTRLALAGALAIMALGAIIFHGIAEFYVDGWKRPGEQTIVALNAAEDRVRAMLSGWLGKGLMVTAGVAIVVVLDSAGLWLARAWKTPSGSHNFAALAPAGIPALLAAARWLAANVKLPTTGSTPARQTLINVARKNLMQVAGLLGLALAAAIAVVWSAVGHFISWTWHVVPAASATARISVGGTGVSWLAARGGAAVAGSDFVGWWPLVIVLFLTLIVAISPSFLNLSSLSTFYAGRLRRAYLGATNLDNPLPPSAKLDESITEQLQARAVKVATDVQINLNRLSQLLPWRAAASAPVTLDAAAVAPQSDAVPAATASNRPDLNPVDSDHPADDMSLVNYYAHSLAPVHLINVTINETRSRGSSLIQRDRRGKPLVISPGGIMFTGGSAQEVDVKPFTGEPGDSLRPGDELPLSVWVGISGAAVSTGLGWRSSLGLSLLTGLANLRLGYWWKRQRTGRLPVQGWADWTQAYLIQEFRADFIGTDGERWNLSDGGHFDNSGIYELIRRKVGFIIACDNGEDEKYGFDDLSRLVRKARIDFDATIDFLNSSELDRVIVPPLRPLFAGLAEFARPLPPPAAIAAIARIAYRSGSSGTLLLIKPRMTGDGPADLVRYTETAKPFPHQSTVDQFFDEAQWESYHELGRRMVEALFQRTFTPVSSSVGTWSPASLSVLPEQDDTASALAPAALTGPEASKSDTGASSSGSTTSALVAALAGLGVVAGVGYSVTDHGKPSTPHDTVTLKLSEPDRAMIRAAVALHNDGEILVVIGQLRQIVVELVAREKHQAENSSDPQASIRIADLTTAINVLANRLRQPPGEESDRTELLAILAEIRGLRGDLAGRQKLNLDQLERIAGKLDVIALRIEATGPRRNIRGAP